tara:strand:+ start:168 stop:1079 length:912 start_codon:yes stop_codon:yes gene_type:complete
MTTHLRNLWDLDRTQIAQVIDRAVQLKAAIRRGEAPPIFAGRVLGLLFEKPSLRTRTSFEVGMFRLGGSALSLSHSEVGLGKREPVADVARVFSSYVDAIVVRTFDHDNVCNLAAASAVPVINGLCDQFHPCQILADLLTIQEVKGDLEGLQVAWVGDGNNVCHSWMIAAAQMGFELRVATPEGFEPDRALLAECLQARPDSVVVDRDPQAMVDGVDVLVTDVWVSMGQEKEAARRRRLFADYQVNSQLMAGADAEAILLHCLPAHRGDEVTAELIDGPQSLAWEEAENRLYAQSALLDLLFQ